MLFAEFAEFAQSVVKIKQTSDVSSSVFCRRASNFVKIIISQSYCFWLYPYSLLSITCTFFIENKNNIRGFHLATVHI